MVNIPIIYEDEYLWIINKPAGIVVNRAASVKEATVQDWVLQKLSPLELNVFAENKEFINRAGIVHRIDKETSGILLMAKTPEVFIALQTQFKAKTIQKVYLAIVHGHVSPKSGQIQAPIGRLPWNRERFGVVPDGKEAITKYQVLSYFVINPDQKKFTWVVLYPLTGRTHQIRVHLKYINHPILGDYLYAGRKTARSDRMWAGRVMLHAWKISFIHPISGCTLAIEAPIPDDMNTVITKFTKPQT